MYWIVEHWQVVLSIFAIAVSVIFGALTLFRTGSVKDSMKVMSQVQDSLIQFLYGGSMVTKYKTLKTNESDRKKATEFTPYKDKYILDPSTGEIEKLPTPENIQDKIDSFLECALERALERFAPKNVAEVDDVAEGYSRCVDDLAGLASAMEIAEEYRDQLGLSEGLSMAQIYEKVDERAKQLKLQLDSFQKSKEGSENESKKEKTE